MIVTSIDLHPAGGGRPRSLARLHVAQIRLSCSDQADYAWWLCEPPSRYSAGVDRAGVIRGWNRMQPAAALVAQAMAAAFEDPQALPEDAAAVVEAWRATARRPPGEDDLQPWDDFFRQVGIDIQRPRGES